MTKTHAISNTIDDRTFILSFDSVDEIGIFKDYQFVEKKEDLIVSYDKLKILQKQEDSNEKENVFTWRSHDTPIYTLLYLIEDALSLIDNNALIANNRIFLMYEDQFVNCDYDINAYLFIQYMKDKNEYSSPTLNITIFPIGDNKNGERISLSIKEMRELKKLIEKYYEIKISYYNEVREELKK